MFIFKYLFCGIFFGQKYQYLSTKRETLKIFSGGARTSIYYVRKLNKMHCLKQKLKEKLWEVDQFPPLFFQFLYPPMIRVEKGHTKQVNLDDNPPPPHLVVVYRVGKLQAGDFKEVFFRYLSNNVMSSIFTNY